jgi:hypothetical protein
MEESPSSRTSILILLLWAIIVSVDLYLLRLAMWGSSIWIAQSGWRSSAFNASSHWEPLGWAGGYLNGGFDGTADNGTTLKGILGFAIAWVHSPCYGEADLRQHRSNPPRSLMNGEHELSNEQPTKKILTPLLFPMFLPSLSAFWTNWLQRISGDQKLGAPLILWLAPICAKYVPNGIVRFLDAAARKEIYFLASPTQDKKPSR